MPVRRSRSSTRSAALATQPLGRLFGPGLELRVRRQRQLHRDLGEAVAVDAALEVGHAQPSKAQDLAVLGFLRDFEGHPSTLRRWHVDLATDDGDGQGHGHLDAQVVALAGESRVGSDLDAEREVPGFAAAAAAAALARGPHPSPITDARRDLDLHLAGAGGSRELDGALGARVGLFEADLCDTLDVLAPPRRRATAG